MSDFDVAFAILPFILIFASVVLIADEMMFKLNSGDPLCGSMNSSAPDAKCQAIMQSGINAMNIWGNFFIFVYLSALLGSLIMASVTPSAPMFWVITFVTVIAVYLTAPLVSNLYLGMVNTGNFNDVLARHQTEIWFFQNLALIALVSHLLVGSVLHGKSQASVRQVFGS